MSDDSVRTILGALLLRASAAPNALAFEVEGEATTYRELAAAAAAMAAALDALGIAPGARCALMLPTGLPFIRALFAAQWAGAIPVAVDPKLPPELAWRRFMLVGCRLVLGRAAALPALETARADAAVRLEAVEEVQAYGARGAGAPRPRAHEVAFLQLTSGTTGAPRAVMVTHRSLLASLRASRDRIGITSEDVLAGWVPLHHDLGLVRFVFTPVHAGCRSHLVQPSAANLARWLETISRVRATITASPDFAYRAAARCVEPRMVDLRSLRFATNGGEPVRLGTIEQFERRFGLPGVVRPGYGLAEATLGVSTLAPGEPVRVDPAGTVSCGRPLDGIEVRVVDPSGGEAPPRHEGEILLRGPQVFAGYFDDAAATAAALRDGWLHTGDAGFLDEEGQLYVLGRRDGLIKRGGATIIPREVEEVVDHVAGVRISAAVGGPGPTPSGCERLIVVAEVEPGSASTEKTRLALADAITRAAAGALGFSPGEVLLVAPRTIPRTSNGKIRYGELRRALAEGRVARDAVAQGGPALREQGSSGRERCVQ